MNTDVVLWEPCATTATSKDSTDAVTRSARDTASACPTTAMDEGAATTCPTVTTHPTMVVTTDPAGGTTDRHTTNGGNDCPVHDASSNGCTREPCAIGAPLGGGVWNYLFPHADQHGTAVAQGWIMKKGENVSSGSGTGPGEPHSWGGVHRRLIRDLVPPPSFRLVVEAVRPHRRDRPA